MDRSPLTIAITGATGLIGSALTARLETAGHTVRRVARSGTVAPNTGGRVGEIPWDPRAGVMDPSALRGCDAVIHLAGEPIARRWTDKRKRSIRESRVQGTTLIAKSIAACEDGPKVLLSGSAIGYYGDRDDEQLDERSTSGTDFLSGVVRDWEGATAAATDAGVRVVLLRTGLVLSTEGGALAKLLPPFRLGLGGPMGSGRQWMSWISLDDHLRIIERALFTPEVRGPVNLVAPNPVTNAEFAKELGRALHRPAFLPLPAFALDIIFGEMARATILSGQRVLPSNLLASGFQFKHPTLGDALRSMLP
jgi:uncharacterized protein (TIGR01777 family)